MIPQDEPHEWSAEALLNKSQSYAEEMRSFYCDDWKFALWSTLSLELLARAALSNISPTLVADARGNWRNLLHALEIQPTIAKFNPRSVPISEVFDRLKEPIPTFTSELEDFCQRHMSKRNEELHTGSTPLVGTKGTSWLPAYYQACEVLLESMNDSLERFFGESEAEFAQAIMAASIDESAKSVPQEIDAHKVVWDNSIEDKEVKALQSSTWATRQTGHRVSCPSCSCVAILSGEPIAPPLRSIEEDEITETFEYLPSRFECVACGLRISGLSRLSAAGLGDTYNATFAYSGNEYFPPDDDYGDYEPDFNER